MMWMVKIANKLGTVLPKVLFRQSEEECRLAINVYMAEVGWGRGGWKLNEFTHNNLDLITVDFT